MKQHTSSSILTQNTKGMNFRPVLLIDQHVSRNKIAEKCFLSDLFCNPFQETYRFYHLSFCQQPVKQTILMRFLAVTWGSLLA